MQFNDHFYKHDEVSLPFSPLWWWPLTTAVVGSLAWLYQAPLLLHLMGESGLVSV
jgi:hypothetical protein